MGRRCELRSFLITGLISFLAFSITAHPSWFYSTGNDANLVSVRTGDDVSEGVGIQPISEPYSEDGSQSLLGRESNEEPLIGWDVDTMNLIQILDYEEGYSNIPYLCSEGYVTVGLGTRLHTDIGLRPKDFPIKVDRDIAESWLYMRVAKHERKLSRRADIGHIFSKLDDDRRAIILSMSYQMGTTGVAKFKKMWRALEDEKYALAAAEALDSKWATQTPGRAHRHAQVLAGITLNNIYASKVKTKENV